MGKPRIHQVAESMIMSGKFYCWIDLMQDFDLNKNQAKQIMATVQSQKEVYKVEVRRLEGLPMKAGTASVFVKMLGFDAPKKGRKKSSKKTESELWRHAIFGGALRGAAR